MRMVWHYAPWAYLARMVESGVLRPSAAGAPGESPLLWFSANQQWEPTATKIFTFKQQAMTLGCIRFGLPADDPRLLNWREACLTAGTPREARRGMVQAGKKRGAHPAQWFAIIAPVPLTELRFQVWLDFWGDADAKEMAEVWTKRQR